jgi:hypothetical protein
MEDNLQKLEKNELEKIRERLFMVQKEKAELLCRSIKFSTKLMAKIISSLECYEKLQLKDNELLIKIKLFLKITRMVVDNSRTALSYIQSDQEKKLFSM